MATPEAHLATLTDEQRLLLERWLVDFDLSWDEGQLGSWARRLPPPGDPLRRPALVEMVKIDLEYRWQRGQRARLEAYLKALPELGAAADLPADLLLAEYEARRGCGAAADLAEFARRFPRQAGELCRLVAEAPDEADGDPAAADRQTVRPSIGGTDPAGPRPSPPGAVAVPGWFGRYRVERELGRGAMGTVYLAHDSQLDRPVALKVPHFSAADGPEVCRRFLSEARAAATIEHPNVCPVYDVGEVNGVPYLTMAFLPGEPLSRLLERPAPLPPRRAAALVRQLAAALQAAHDKGVIHRDLKPSNVILNARGEPVVLDFGLARRLGQDARLTQTGQPVGTPAYMSPEQVAGAVGRMGPACDVYALGVILYQLLAGRLPFEGSVAEVLGRILSQPPEPPSRQRPDVDPRLEAICLRAMSKEPAGRYGSMLELGAALADYLRATTPPGAAPARPAGHRWRRAYWVLLACSLALAAVAALAWAFRGGEAAGTVRIEMDDPSADVEVQVDGERVAATAVREPLRLPVGKHHLLVTGKKVQPVSTSFVVGRGDNPAVRVPLVPAADPAPPPAPPRRRHHEHEDNHGERDDD